jgi:hypothetical protein
MFSIRSRFQFFTFVVRRNNGFCFRNNETKHWITFHWNGASLSFHEWLMTLSLKLFKKASSQSCSVPLLTRGVCFCHETLWISGAAYPWVVPIHGSLTLQLKAVTPRERKGCKGVVPMNTGLRHSVTLSRWLNPQRMTEYMNPTETARETNKLLSARPMLMITNENCVFVCRSLQTQGTNSYKVSVCMRATLLQVLIELSIVDSISNRLISTVKII